MIELQLDTAKLIHKAILYLILRDGIPRDMVLLTDKDITELRKIAIELRDSINICNTAEE
jgi:hypothetical protein